MPVPQQTVIESISDFINLLIGSDNPSGQLVTVIEGEEGHQDQLKPYCLFTIEDDEPIHAMNKEFLNVNVSVTIFGDKMQGSKEIRDIMDILVNALDTNPIRVDGYSNEIVFVTNKGVASTEDGVVEIEMNFNLQGF